MTTIPKDDVNLHPRYQLCEALKGDHGETLRLILERDGEREEVFANEVSQTWTVIKVDRNGVSRIKSHGEGVVIKND